MQPRLLFRRAVPILAMLLALPAWADSAYSDDVSDLWWTANESGWGLNLIQQADLAFGTMFVYGPDGKPKWYVASNMQAVGLGSDGRSAHFVGALYETTGPVSPNAFDSSQVTYRQVGTIDFDQEGSISAFLQYTVDGVAVSKHVQRYTWKTNDISGLFNASRVVLGFNCAPSAPVTDNLGPTTLSQSGSTISISTAGGTPSTTCNYSGSYSQGGRMGVVEGAYSCNDGNSGTFRMEEVEANPHGISAYYQAIANGCQVRGHFGGARATVVPPPD